MDVSLYRSKLAVVRNKIGLLNSEIERAQYVNESRRKLLTEKSRLEELIEDTTVYLNTLKVVQSRTIKENDDFKTRRLNLLNAEITDSLAKVMPEKSFRANVKCDFNRKNRVITSLIDANGAEFSPKMSNGKLVQYVTTFSGISGIVKALGIKNLYVDEAFGVSSINRLPAVGDYINSLVGQGIQIILVSQNDGLYRDIPRREFHLKFESTGNRAILEKVVDY